MNITSVFIEILITGLQASLWIVLLVLNARGAGWFPDAIDIFREWASLLSLAMLSIIYTLGIFVDALAIGFFNLINPKKLIKKISWLSKKVVTTAENYYFSILVNEGKATEMLGSNRIKIRIVRSTAFNIIFITISLLALIRNHCDPSNCAANLYPLVAVVGTLSFLFLTLMLGIMELTFETDLRVAEEHLKNPICN